jgi:hypothetical protein
MAVLVEGIAVVVKGESVVEKYDGGEKRFKQDVSGLPFCSDGELACLHFMVPSDVRNCVALLERRGLRYAENEAAVDLVVADQRDGLLVSCDWVAFGRSLWEGDPRRMIATCSAKPTKFEGVVVPDAWQFESSLSEKHRFVELNKIDHIMKFVRRERGVDVYFDPETCKEYYAVRTPV